MSVSRQKTKSVVNLFIIGDKNCAIPGTAKRFESGKTKHCDVGKGANRHPIIERARSQCGILHDFQVVMIGDGSQQLDIGGMTVHIDGQERPCFIGD